MIPPDEPAMELPDETKEVGRKLVLEMDAWKRVRLAAYAESILSPRGDREALMGRMALAFPHFLAELRRVTDLDSTQIPPNDSPAGQGAAEEGGDDAPDTADAPPTAVQQVASVGRVETLAALGKMLDAAPKTLAARRAVIVGPIADGVQALQEAGTRPDMLVRELVSMLRPAPEDYRGPQEHQDYYNLAPYLRRVLEETRQFRRRQTWNRALFGVADVLDDAVMLLPEPLGEDYARRASVYFHELLHCAVEAPLPGTLLPQVAELYARSVKHGFPQDPTEPLRHSLLLIRAKHTAERAEPGEFSRLEQFGLLPGFCDAVAIAQSIRGLVGKLVQLSRSDAAKDLIRIASVALILGTEEQRRCLLRLGELRNRLLSGSNVVGRALLSALRTEISFGPGGSRNVPSRNEPPRPALLDQLVQDLGAAAPQLKNRLSPSILAPLAAMIVGLYPHLAASLRRHLRPFGLNLEGGAEGAFEELLARLTDNLAIEVVGKPLFGTRVEWRLAAMRALFEQTYPDTRRDASEAVLRLIDEIVALPADPQELVKAAYGPYLADGVAAIPDAVSPEEWRRLVTEASGAHLPADLAAGLRACFSGKAEE